MRHTGRKHTFPDQVLDLICSQCDKDTLATLARASEQISHAALKALWADVSSVESLRHVMPSDMCNVSSNGRVIVSGLLTAAP